MVKVKFDLNRKDFLLVGVIVLLLGVGFAYAYNSNPGKPSAMGHSANEVEVNINGKLMNLQQAIDGGLIGGSSVVKTISGIPKGYVEKFQNLGEDVYGPLIKNNGGGVDSCDGNSYKSYACTPQEDKTCRDVYTYDYSIFGYHHVAFGYRTVNCKKTSILVRDWGHAQHTIILKGNDLYRLNVEVSPTARDARELCYEKIPGSKVVSSKTTTHPSSCGGTYNQAVYSGAKWDWNSIGCGSRITVFTEVVCKG